MNADIELEVLLNLPISELRNLCQKNRLAAEIYRSNSFWVQRFSRDYPNILFNQDNAKDEYITVYKKRLNSNQN